jgi:hypothetical protein
MIEINLTRAAYNRPFPVSEKDCSAYIKAKDGKSYKLTFECSRSKEISEDWNGEIMWDQVDLLRSNPALLAFEEVDAEQIYVDGLGSPNLPPSNQREATPEERLRRGEDDSRDARFLNMQVASLDPKHQLNNWNTFDKWKEKYWQREYPNYSPTNDTSRKYPPTESPVGTPGKWQPMVWRQEFPNFAPKTNESVPKNVEKSFTDKNKEQSIQSPKEPDGRMKVPMASKEMPTHYELDLDEYAKHGFYDQNYPGLGPNSKTAKAEQPTHYDGVYQDEPWQQKPAEKVSKKYKIGIKKTKDNQYQYHVLIEAPFKLYKNFMVAEEKKV